MESPRIQEGHAGEGGEEGVRQKLRGKHRSLTLLGSKKFKGGKDSHCCKPLVMRGFKKVKISQRDRRYGDRGEEAGKSW